MTHEQRQEYIRQAKQAFHSHKEYSGLKAKESADDGSSINGFWKVRFIIAIIIFVCAVSVTNSNVIDIKNFQEKVVHMIQRDANMESVQAWFQQHEIIPLEVH